MTTLVVGALLFIVISLSLSFPIDDATKEAAAYLQKFGYFGDTGSDIGSLKANVISRTLKEFQRFSGLDETGVLDEETLALMKTPRCGVKDNTGHASSAKRRRKRYALHGSKWRNTHLYYRISKYPGRLKDRKKVDKEIEEAFKRWSDVTPLIFEQRQRRGRASIDIRFEEEDYFTSRRLLGDADILAMAEYPRFGGDIHFNDSKEWNIDGPTDEGVSLLEVAIHELGHSLGLMHSDGKKSIMRAHYNESVLPQVKLDIDDVKAIQHIYGANEIFSQPADDPSGPPPDKRGAPNLCQDASFDTITQTKDGNTYIFKGAFYWKYLTEGLANGYPRKISQDWGGLEGNLDASVSWASGKTYFFKDKRYWRFTNREMDFGYPRFLNQGFEGIPDGLDAAFEWGGNGKTYFLKGDKYWRYDSDSDPPVSEEYPKPISRWAGLPTNIDAACQFKNGRNYFFKGDKYYRFNDAKFQVDEDNPPFPRHTSAGWFNC